MRLMRVCLVTTLAVISATLPVLAQGHNKSGADQYYNRRDWNGLVEYSKGWTAEQPNNGLAWFLLGMGNYKGGNFEAAAEAFKQDTICSPTEPRGWANLGAAYAKTGQDKLAAKAFSDGMVASASKCSATDWYVFGNGLKNLNQFEAAIGAYDKALRMQPNFPEANNNKGVCLVAIGDHGGAKNAYSTAARQGDTLSAGNAAALNRSEQPSQPIQGGQSSRPNWNNIEYMRRNGGLHTPGVNY